MSRSSADQQELAYLERSRQIRQKSVEEVQRRLGNLKQYFRPEDRDELTNAIHVLSSQDKEQFLAYLQLAKSKLAGLNVWCRGLAMEYSKSVGSVTSDERDKLMNNLNMAHRQENMMTAIVDALEHAQQPF